MRKVFAVAWREFRHTVLRPVFIIAIIGIPVLVAGVFMVAVMMMMTQTQPGIEGTIVIVTRDAAVVDAARIEFDSRRITEDESRRMREAAERTIEQFAGPGNGSGLTPGISGNQGMTAQRGEVRITIEHAPPDGESIAEVRTRLRERAILAYLILDDEVLAAPDQSSPRAERPRFQMGVSSELISDLVRLIEERAGLTVVRVRAERAGHQPERLRALVERPLARTTTFTEVGPKPQAAEGMRELRAQIIPMIFMILIMIGTISSANYLMMSTIEEKSSRVMEVLLSAVSPLQLMTGKILGYGAVGLIIVQLYVSLGIAVLGTLSMTHFISAMDLVYLVVFYLMAYFMIASMMAAVGSAVSDIREANTLITPMMIILFIPLMLWMPISQSPNGLIAVVCSFLPPLIPFAMILRVSAEEPVAMWQIIASIIWGFTCVVLIVLGAAKIFRMGVLMTGKPPTPLELLKWIRYS